MWRRWSRSDSFDNTGIVSFGHEAFMALGAYLSGILTMPAALQRFALLGAGISRGS